MLRMQWFQLRSLAQLHHSQLQEVVISMLHGRQRPNCCCQVLQEGTPQKHGMIYPKNFDETRNPKVDLGSASTSEIDITNCNATSVRSCGENVISLSRDSSKTLTVVSSSLWPNFAKAQMKLDKFWLRNSVRISTARKAMPLMSSMSLKAKLAKAQMLLAHSCGLNSLTWFLAVDEAVYLLYTFNGLV